VLSVGHRLDDRPGTQFGVIDHLGHYEEQIPAATAAGKSGQACGAEAVGGELGTEISTSLVGLPHPRRDFGDRIPVEQVLINLLKNAIEATADNGAKARTISISCAAEGDGLRFSIRDNGCGLPDSADRIFEAFHTTKSDGLGLGLKICHTIVKVHGGRLWAENNKSRGASFHFLLPLHPETA
jgi:signal transduction histidine kinase